MATDSNCRTAVKRSLRRGIKGKTAPIVAALFAVLLTVLFAEPLAAQTAGGYQPAEWAKTLAAARKEGKVVFYTAQPTGSLARLVDGFKKAHPDIAMESTRGPSAQLFPRVQQELASGADGGDVWITTELLWLIDRAREKKLLRPAGPASTGWPAQFLVDGTVLLAGREPFVIPYNKNLVPNPPRGYADLLRPEFRGRVGTSELAATTVVAFYDWLEKTQGGDFLEKLRAQNPKLYLGGVPIAQAVASGEVSVGVFGQPTATQPLMDKGAPIGYIVPNPGLGVEYIGAAFGWSRRPNAALVLLDYLMSAEGQTAWHGTGETASPRPGIPGSLAISSITPWDPHAYPADVANRYRERWTRMFK